MKRIDVVRALRSIGATAIRDKGEHTIYGCACGEHIAPLPRHNEISPGVVASIQKQMACAPKGWLQ